MRGAAANGHRKAIAMSDRLPEGNFEERISKLEAAGKVTLEAHIRRVNSLNDQLDELEAARDSLDMLLTQATSRIKELEAELDDYKSRLERVVRSSSQTDVRNGGPHQGTRSGLQKTRQRCRNLACHEDGSRSGERTTAPRNRVLLWILQSRLDVEERNLVVQ